MAFVSLAARLVLASVFAVAAVAKSRDPEGTRTAMEGFGIPRMLLGPIAILLPMVELAVAALLLIPATVEIGALAALGLLAAFIVMLVTSLVKGRRPDCNCFGQMSAAPIGWSTVLRNVLLAGLAVAALAGADRPVGDAFAWVEGLSAIERGLAIAIAVLSVVVVGQGLFSYALLKQNGRILLQLEEMTGGAEAPAGASAPPLGLPVGSSAPDFALPGLHGETMTLEALLAEGKPAMLVFTDPGCGPCNALMPDLASWQKSQADALNVVVISEKDAKANRVKAEKHGLNKVLLQKGREVAEAYQYAGTPSAVIVAPDGTIASPVAAGPPNIRALVARSVGRPTEGAAPTQSSRRSPGPTLGSEAPAIRLPDLAGDEVDLSDYRGRSTLVIFWNPTCGFCRKMLPELKAWEAAVPPGAPALLFVSRGSVGENIEQGIRSKILLDQDFSVAGTYGASGTPMGILVDANGKIASELAVGAPAVLALATPPTRV